MFPDTGEDDGDDGGERSKAENKQQGLPVFNGGDQTLHRRDVLRVHELSTPAGVQN